MLYVVRERWEPLVTKKKHLDSEWSLSRGISVPELI